MDEIQISGSPLLTIIPKTEKQIVKVTDCSYSDNNKTVTSFYFCSCSKEEFYPICEACTKTCHKDHGPFMSIKGIYTCKCGENNHEITQENEDLLSQRKHSSQDKCLYSKFMEITPHDNFYMYKEKTFCSVCVQYCRKKNEESDLLNLNSKNTEEEVEIGDDNELIKIDGINKCACSKHFEHTCVNINSDLISKQKFHLHLQNFNFNIFSKISITEDQYITYLILRIKEYVAACNNKPSKHTEAFESKKFFSHFKNYKILECFSMFAQRWENKFFYIKDYFDEIPKENLVKLMSLTENVSEINETVINDFFSAKFYFAELIFNYLIRGYMLKYNNLWNIRTIINMNLYQRALYIQKIKQFYQFQREEKVYNNNIINEMINSLLELYEKILTLNDFDEYSFFSYMFPTFTRIFKYMIKYNFLSRAQREQYFDMMLSTLEKWAEFKKKVDEKTQEKSFSEHLEEQKNGENEKQHEDDSDIKKKIYETEEDENKSNKGAFYLMKSILYTLIYKNDQVCLNYLKDKIDGHNKKFVFMKDPLNEKLCNIFVMIINTFYRKEDLNRTIMYDFYVRKILEILILQGNFYQKSLENLSRVQEIEIKLLLSQDFHSEVMKNIHVPFFEKINTFALKLSILNRQYFDYEIKLDSYILKTNEIMGELKNFIIQEVGYIPNIQSKYLPFIQMEDELKIKNIEKFQSSVIYTLFFQKMEEYIHIYAEGKTFTFNGDEPLIQIDMKNHKELLKFILRVYYLLIQNNYENLTLVMNIKPKIFISAFIDTGEALFDFFERMTEMMSTGNYEFDNIYFFSECMCFIINYIIDYFTKRARSLEQDLVKLTYLGKVMKLTSFCLNKVNILQTDLLNVIDSLQYFSYLVNSNPKFSDISNYFIGYFDDHESSTWLCEILINYFNYMSDLIENDFNFFSATAIKDCYLFNVNEILSRIHEIVEENFFPLELHYAIIRYFLSSKITLGFNTDKIQNQMIRIFKPTSVQNANEMIKNASLPNLALNEPTETKRALGAKFLEVIDKYNDIADLLEKLCVDFRARIKNVIKKPSMFRSQFEMKIILYKVFENVLVRPTYTFVNFYILTGENVLGKYFRKIRKLIFEFIKTCCFFYQTVSMKKFNEEFFEKEKEDYFSLCEDKLEIFAYENISLVKELTKSEIEEAISDLKEIKNKTQHYHVNTFYTKLVNNVEKISYTKPMNIKSIRETLTKTKIKPKKIPSYVQRLNKLINKYKKKVTSTYDTELSLFNSLEESEKVMSQKIGKELLMYLLYKLSDTLTDENFLRMGDTYHKGTIKDISIKNLKLQNANVLVFLNGLFYNYSEYFQKTLSECIGEYFYEVFEFFSTDIIFSCNVNEVTKLYGLEHIRDFNQVTGEKNPKLCSEICCLSIKLLQNMCESHNRIFQTRFFSFRFDVEHFEYLGDGKEKIQKNIKNSEKKDLIVFDKKEDKIIQKIEENEEINTNLIEQQKKKEEEKKIEDKKEEEKKVEEKKEGEPKKKSIWASLRNKYKKAEETRVRSDSRKSETKSIGFNEEMVKKKILNDQAEAESEKCIKDIRFSFFNFITNNMRLIAENLHISSNIINKILKNSQKITSTENIIDIYQHFADLVVEMVQGTNTKNFDNFYQNLTDSHQIFGPNGKENNITLDSFEFMRHCNEMKKILFETNNLFDEQLLNVALNMFTIIVNVIAQEVTDRSLLQQLIIIFPPMKILTTVSTYLKGLMIRHVKEIDYDDPIFEEEYNCFEFNNSNYTLLINFFKEHIELYEDPFFKLASQMYLCLTILGKKYKIAEAERIIKYDEKEIVEEEDQEQSKKNALLKGLIGENKIKIGLKKNSTLSAFRKKEKHEINNLIITSKFFNKIIKTCEFKIENNDELDFKTVYFIVDPRVYFISKNSIQKFLDEVDRSTPSTKLEALIDVADNFFYEVNFKHSTFQKASYLKWMFDFDYLNVDKFNFCCSLIICTIFFFFLDYNPIKTKFVYGITVAITIFQIFINLIFLTIFFMSKYSFYVTTAKSRRKGDSLTVIDYLQIYIFDTVIFNDEINLMILIMIMGAFGILSKHGKALFSLQLLSVIKLLESLKEIIIAFKHIFGQFISIIGFMVIFTYLFSNFAYTFFSSEFNIELDDGSDANICSCLLECFITYFNQGIRSGGGIGDVLESKDYGSEMYWVRFFNDWLFFVIIIMMLLNMIAGIVVSAFSQIRESSEAKTEDVKNRCFICNRERSFFERMKIQFDKHKKNDHNVTNYIRFLICLKQINEKDLDSDRTFILECIKNKEIKFFPINKKY